jgi:8-oxo-dGTP pyrophosphatase MutT (NUDIX family)
VSALAILTGWEPPDVAQQQLRDEFVAHLRIHANGVTREGRPDHVTASVLVMSDDRREVLLGLHAKVGRWLQFGGHVEPADTSLAAAALREGVEESGIGSLRLVNASPVRLDRHPAPCGGGARHHLDVQFLATAAPTTSPRVSSESRDVRWFGVADLPSDSDHAVRALVAEALSRSW